MVEHFVAEGLRVWQVSLVDDARSKGAGQEDSANSDGASGPGKLETQTLSASHPASVPFDRRRTQVVRYPFWISG